MDQGLDFAFSPQVDMNGGSLGIDFELDTTLTFHVDSAAIVTAATAPPTALSVDPATINLCANATGSVGVFTARFGFTDVKVSTDDPATTGTTEAAKLHACAQVAFSDPDSTGGITLDEWTSHALTELATADIVDGNAAGDDLDVKLYADASLVGGDAFATNTAADASMSFTDAELSPQLPRSRRTRLVGPGLQAWLNITAGDVANGLDPVRLVARGRPGPGQRPAAAARQVARRSIFDGIKPLLGLHGLAHERDGRLRHGARRRRRTSRRGPIDNLTAGTPVYCRAQTQRAVDADHGRLVRFRRTSTATVDDERDERQRRSAQNPTRTRSSR